MITIFLIQQLFIIQSSREQQIDHKVFIKKKEGQLDNLYIIFLNGLGCKFSGDFSEELGFPKIRRSLASAGYSYYDHRFLLYSYTGGKVVKGKWYPNKYSAADTGQPIPLSVNRLKLLIDEFSKAHPEARYILVGHSLGGRIALDFACSADPGTRQKIKGVTTLNSPLLGASIKLPGKVLDIINFANCFNICPAVKQLLWEVNYQKEITSQRRQDIYELQREDLRVATFATHQDLVVRPFTGCILDEQGRPVTDGFIVNVKASHMSFKEIFGHMKILEKEEVIKYIITLCSK
ncbi:lipase/acyltransferase domain-containing protein [Desulforamulus putei]|uniref:lipase/acyltransferase domain-containing protein n=1 Tax=Desulforamulus putei TaxID=74701 RepID=UPI0013564403|nr:hypothetical protein [Desulforamulus putei]